MAFPFLSENGFETGGAGHFDAISPDPFTRAGYDHYSELARRPGLPAPFTGAYCFRVNLATNTTNHYLQETGSWDTGAAGTIFVRFMFWFGANPTMADGDEFAIFQLWSGASTAEAGVYVNYTDANGYRLGIGETAATSFLSLSLNTWHAVEIQALIDSGAPNDGTLDGWLDGGAFTQVTSLNQGAITSGVLGVVGQDAGTTAGVVLFDDVIADDARIYPPSIRFSTSPLLTISGHAFVGPGRIDAARLMAGAATDNVLSIYDTDVGNTNDATKVVLELKNTANSQVVCSVNEEPIRVQRGCYVVMSGTTPRANIDLSAAVYGGDGVIRAYGSRRVATKGNV